MDVHTFPIDRYYLDYNIKVLTLLGVWNPYKNTRKYWFYDFYSFILLLIVIFMRMIGEFHKMWMLRDDLVATILPMTECVSYMFMLLKCINLISRQSDIVDIMDKFNWERRMLCSREIALNRNHVLGSTVKYSEVFTHIFTVISMIFTVVGFSSSIDIKNLTIDTLPISATPVKILLKPFNIWTALVFDWIAYSFYCGLFFIHDVLFLNLMMNIATQLDLLNFRLADCSRMNNTDQFVKLREDSCKINFECCEFKEDAQFTPNEELVICIQHYNKIYWMVKVLLKVAQPFLLPQIMISLLWISLLGFNLFVATSVTKKEDIVETVYITIDVIAGVVQIFIICWTGQNIITGSDRVLSAIYEANWYYGDKSFRRNSLIFQSLVMNPMIIRAIGVFDLSALTFKNILMKSYSAIALIRHVYD